MKTNRTSLATSDLSRLTQRHLTEWLTLLDHLQDTHAPTDELTFCRNQVTRLQLDLYQLRNTGGHARAN